MNPKLRALLYTIIRAADYSFLVIILLTCVLGSIVTFCGLVWP